jgi:hypothetical protein
MNLVPRVYDRGLMQSKRDFMYQKKSQTMFELNEVVSDVMRAKRGDKGSLSGSTSSLTQRAHNSR